MRKKEHHKLGGGSAVSTVRLVKEELEILGNTGNELLSVLQEALTEQFHRAEFWGRGHRARGRERDEVWDELEKLRALSSCPGCFLGERIQLLVAAGEGQNTAGTP